MIKLPWPPTDNHDYTVVRGRKILSTKGRAYKKQAVLEMMAQNTPKGLEGDCSVFIRAYPPDKRRRDLTNILKALMDSLQDAGVYKDDSQVTDLRIQKFNPSKPGRVEVMVSANEV